MQRRLTDKQGWVEANLPKDAGDRQFRLARFIADRRRPGPGWMSFDQITKEIYALTKISVGRATLEAWARDFGIPRWTPTKLRPEPTAEQAEDFDKAVARYFEQH